MQKAYRCKNCEYVHNGIVSNCDCNNEKFAYDPVYIYSKEEHKQTKEMKCKLQKKEVMS